MSFYGNIKRVNSSPYIFDKIYPNRKDMDDNCTKDGVYISRYVLVKYTKTYDENNKLVDCERLNDNGEGFSAEYQNNINIDSNKYHNTFDATVWQKIYTEVGGSNTQSEKYILIARLNGSIPSIELKPIPPKYFTNNNDDEEAWTQPKALMNASTEEAYVMEMPDVLHLDVSDNGGNLFNEDLLKPNIRTVITPEGEGVNGAEPSMFDENNNYMRWANYRGENPVNHNSTLQSGEDKVYIDTKKLETKLNGVGQAVSDLYDILYGKPEGGKGNRPFFTEDTSVLLDAIGNMGLVGVLSSIGAISIGDGTVDSGGRTIKSGDYYYLVSKWTDALEDPNHFIENIPGVIGASSAAGGSAAESHYYIDFNESDNFIKVISG